VEDVRLLSHMGSGGLENNILFRRNLSCTGLGSQMSLDGSVDLLEIASKYLPLSLAN